MLSRDSDLERHKVLTIMNYQKIHDSIIKRAKTRKLEGYKERHHVIPRCLGGTDDNENLIELTAREHFLVHKLLCEIYPDNKQLFYGYYAMSHLKSDIQHERAYKIGAREFERVRLQHSEYVSKHMLGKVLSESTKQKLRDVNLGKKYIRSNEYRKNISNAQKGKIFSDEHRKNLSESHKGQIPWNKGKKMKPLTEEHKKKVSESLKGRVVLDSTRKLIGDIHRGKVTSEETKQKIRDTKLKNKLKKLGENK